MHANTCWGLLAFATTFALAVLGLSPEYVWLRPYLLNSAFTCLAASVACFFWPLVKRRIINDSTKLHPARYSEKDTSLIEAVLWIAERSSWGRWQEVQRGGWLNEESKLFAASSFAHVAAKNGDLVVRGRLRNSVEYKTVDRDFWRRAYIGIKSDPISLWKAVVVPYDGQTASVPDYDHLLVEQRTIESLWPRRDLQTDWLTFRLKLRSGWKRMKDQKPTASLKPSEPAQSAETPPLNSSPDAIQPSSGIEEQTKPSVESSKVIVTPHAPNDWEHLFAIGDGGRSVWLRFLPDTKNYRADTLVLIIYGQKVLLNTSRVQIEAAHAAVEKTVQNAPNEPRINSGFLATMIAVQQLHAAANRDWVEQCVPRYLERVGLSQGGFYQLTEDGERHATGLAYDLIRRA